MVARQSRRGTATVPKSALSTTTLRSVVCGLGLLVAPMTLASGVSFQGTYWAEAADRHGVPVEYLYSIALAESRTAWSDGLARPYPYVVRYRDEVTTYPDREAAKEGLSALLEDGADKRRIDVGLMQKNLHWHGDRVSAYHEYLDPRIAIDAAASYLAETLASAPDNPALGIGRYHTWEPLERAKAYGDYVLRLACELGGPCHTDSSTPTTASAE